MVLPWAPRPLTPLARRAPKRLSSTSTSPPTEDSDSQWRAILSLEGGKATIDSISIQIRCRSDLRGVQIHDKKSDDLPDFGL